MPRPGYSTWTDVARSDDYVVWEQASEQYGFRLSVMQYSTRVPPGVRWYVFVSTDGLQYPRVEGIARDAGAAKLCAESVAHALAAGREGRPVPKPAFLELVAMLDGALIAWPEED